MSHHILLCEAIENVGEDDAIIVIPPDMSDEEQENGEPAGELEICNDAEIGEETVLPNETASEYVWGKNELPVIFPEAERVPPPYETHPMLANKSHIDLSLFL